MGANFITIDKWEQACILSTNGNKLVFYRSMGNRKILVDQSEEGKRRISWAGVKKNPKIAEISIFRLKLTPLKAQEGFRSF